jgi:5-methylcytosine-specific restriction endonuclease McrA
MPYKYPFSTTDEQTKKAVWQKGKTINENGTQYDPNIWRRDTCGRAMKYSDHGDTASKYGWEIDHIKPEAKGGKTSLDNLQPLYWENNRKKGDTYPWSCS